MLKGKKKDIDSIDQQKNKEKLDLINIVINSLLIIKLIILFLL